MMTHFGIKERDFNNKVEIPLQIKQVGNRLVGTTYTEPMIRIHGKRKSTNVEHNYCPFCGDKIEKEVSNESIS